MEVTKESIPLKERNFDKMTPEEKTAYAVAWNENQEDVMLSLAAAFEHKFKINRHNLEFHRDLKELTDNQEKLTASALLDVHEIHDIPLRYSGKAPYAIYGTLFDFVLHIAAEITDKKLGYYQPDESDETNIDVE